MSFRSRDLSLEEKIVEEQQSQQDIADIFAVQNQLIQQLSSIATASQPLIVNPPQAQAKSPNYLLYIGIGIVGFFLYKKLSKGKLL